MPRPKSELFDAARYPNLRRVTHSEQYGRMELISVSETSDGFLLGHAKCGKGDDAYYHSVFLGDVSNFREI